MQRKPYTRYSREFKLEAYQQRVVGIAGEGVQRDPHYQSDRKAAERAKKSHVHDDAALGLMPWTPRGDSARSLCASLGY